MGHNTYFLKAYLSRLMTWFSLCSGVRVREESDAVTRRFHKTLPAQRCLSHQLCSMVPGQGWGHTAHLFSPNTHVQMYLPSQPYAHKHACTHALTHARARTQRNYYTLVLNGKSCHLQFQIKACLSAYGRHHQQQLGVPSKTGH